MEERLQPYDVVWIESHGRLMTVVRIRPENDLVECEWYANGRRITGNFAASLLELVSRSLQQGAARGG